MSEIITVGLDLAKNVFQVHGADGVGRAVLRKKLRRAQVLEFFSQLPSCVVAMEACGGAHFWGREIGKLGHHLLRPKDADRTWHGICRSDRASGRLLWFQCVLARVPARQGRSHSWSLASERPRHTQDMLADIGQDEVGRDRGHLIQSGLAELALDIVFARKAEAAMSLDAGICRFPAGIGGQ